MLKLLPNFTSLGLHLKRTRKDQRLTQGELAQQARLSIDTLGLLEHDKGNLSSFWTVLHTLNPDIVGRNLPPGASIGERIIALRHRRGVSQRELIKLVGVSHPTLIELERYCTGRLHTLDRVLLALGAGAYLAPQSSVKALYSHAGNSSTHHGWETPKEVLEPLYNVFGDFDLDPCSPCSNSRTAPVRAKVHYTETDDGLSLPWFGTLYMNPPYGRGIHHWTAKAKAEVAQGNAEVGVCPEFV
jgi:transcriptional regulator with XRE-family HTH domain